MRKDSIDGSIRMHLLQRLGESDLVEAVMSLHGWVDGEQWTVNRAAEVHGVDPAQLRKYIHVSNLGLDGVSNPALERALGQIRDNLPMPHSDLLYHLDVEMGLLEDPRFNEISLANAADAYGDDLGFVSVSRNLHKWFLAEDDQWIVEYAESWIGELVKLVEREAIVHVDQLERFLKRVSEDFTLENIWKVVHACPKLSTGTYPYVFAKEPVPHHTLVRRIDRLLSWAHPNPVPIDIVYRQVYRDQSESYIYEDSLFNISLEQAFTGFLLKCDYYSVGLEGVRQSRDIPVDQALSPNEKLVVQEMIGYGQGVEIDELDSIARECKCSETEARRILLSSPVISTADDVEFNLLESSEFTDAISPWDDLFRYPFWQLHPTIDVSENAPSEHTQPYMSPGHDGRVGESQEVAHGADVAFSQPSESIEVVDLWELSRDSWIGIYTGEIDESALIEIEDNGERWTPVILRKSDSCQGVVRTSRLRNKYSSGNKQIDSDDAKLKGIELARFVDRVELNEALAKDICVFFNESPGVWGVVFRSDL